MLNLNVGDQPVVLGDVAEYPNPAFATDPTQPQFLPDPNATIHWEDSANSGAVTIADLGTVDGAGTASFTPVAAGTATIQDFATDPDGHQTPLGVIFDIVVSVPVATDATQLAGITVVSNPNTGTPTPVPTPVPTPTPVPAAPAPIPVPAG